ncbi:unnamed protein product, partial [Haemonchus placei]|uniref:Neur_chan_LBD domain-containing protein n=1 Tax=Haemonchus placei TaxID=6290 RepID=A0A0N4WX30_HAEPC
WTDPQLAWNRNKTTYSREWIKIPETSVWVPDIIYTEATERDEMVPVDERMADLRYDGTVRVSNPTIVTYPCPLHIDSFPYDINFSSQHIRGNSEWELHTIRVSGIQKITGHRKSFGNKEISRNITFQIPTFIMTTLTIFGIFTPFSNTPERREKVTLVLNMFVSISMMLNLVAEMMPKASRLPLLGNYILSEIFVCAGALLVSIVTLVLHQRFHTRCSLKREEASIAASVGNVPKNSNGIPFQWATIYHSKLTITHVVRRNNSLELATDFEPIETLLTYPQE